MRGAINSGEQTATGLVSIVQFSAGSGNGVSITVITLTSNGMANTFSFCGDQRPMFPMNNQVQVSFVAATPCSSAIPVLVG